ncbi:hypothetical protein STEG23_004835, partial [Scotinomys teguina]
MKSPEKEEDSRGQPHSYTASQGVKRFTEERKVTVQVTYVIMRNSSSVPPKDQ